MAEGRSLRRIGDPVVAAVPAGVRIRTRIGVTAEEGAALRAIGELLGSVYRGELAERLGLGRLDRKSHAVWRAQRKRALTAVSSSRWAGAITRTVEDQYQLGLRGLAAHVADLGAAIEVLEWRCARRPGEPAPHRAMTARRPAGARQPHTHLARRLGHIDRGDPLDHQLMLGVGNHLRCRLIHRRQLAFPSMTHFAYPPTESELIHQVGRPGASVKETEILTGVLEATVRDPARSGPGAKLIHGLTHPK